MNDPDLLRKYSDILEGKQLNESMGISVANVILQRLNKSYKMVEDLRVEIGDDDFPETQSELIGLANALNTMIVQTEAMIKTFNSEADNQRAAFTAKHGD